MSKKNDSLNYDVRARITAEAERDLALATLEALKKEMAAAPPPAAVVALVAPAPAPDPLAAARATYQQLKATDPYGAAAFILQHGMDVAK